MADKNEEHIEVKSNVIDVVQRLLHGEDPTDKIEYEQLQVSSTLDESQQLWYDVLDLAVADYKENLLADHTSGKNIFSEVFNWFFNEHANLAHLGSFENVCLSLNMNPSVIRKKLILWTQEVYNKEPIKTSLQNESIKQAIPPNVLYINKADII